jgi:hypothetical protein
LAESPSHKFGQIVGNLLEAVIRPFLDDFCRTHGLYLDHQEKTRPARKGKKVTWQDPYGNSHDLDYVIERNGSDAVIGSPVAFIEVAWRRYTKHSRNKAQEIQGAILPLADKYKWHNPFLGTILAGIFTEGSIQQLRSLGFQVLYFPYETLVASFAEEGIDIQFDEATPDEEFQKCVNIVESASDDTMQRIRDYLVELNRNQIQHFMNALDERLSRMVEKVVIVPLYGRANEFATIEDAISFLDQHPIYEGSGQFRKYEVYVSFSNGDKVEGSFTSKQKAREFLEFVATQ